MNNNNNNNTHMTVETFDNNESAEQAFKEALKLGYSSNDINVIMSENTKLNYYSNTSDTEKEEEAAKDLAVGGVLGGTIGGTIGALIALGTNIALPGLGVIMVGPLIGAGGVYGGLLGSLIGWGSTDNPPNAYEDKLKEGQIILPGYALDSTSWVSYVYQSTCT